MCNCIQSSNTLSHLNSHKSIHFFFGSSPLLQNSKQHGGLITASLSEKEHLFLMQTCCKTEIEKDKSDPERDTKSTLIRQTGAAGKLLWQLGTSSAASTATPEPVTACKTKTLSFQMVHCEPIINKLIQNTGNKVWYMRGMCFCVTTAKLKATEQLYRLFNRASQHLYSTVSLSNTLKTGKIT